MLIFADSPDRQQEIKKRKQQNEEIATNSIYDEFIFEEFYFTKYMSEKLYKTISECEVSKFYNYWTKDAKLIFGGTINNPNDLAPHLPLVSPLVSPLVTNATTEVNTLLLSNDEPLRSERDANVLSLTFERGNDTLPSHFERRNCWRRLIRSIFPPHSNMEFAMIFVMNLRRIYNIGHNICSLLFSFCVQDETGIYKYIFDAEWFYTCANDVYLKTRTFEDAYIYIISDCVPTDAVVLAKLDLMIIDKDSELNRSIRSQYYLKPNYNSQRVNNSSKIGNKLQFRILISFSNLIYRWPSTIISPAPT
jgi:hypothetical protein